MIEPMKLHLRTPQVARAWIKDAAHGAVIEYWRGFLPYKREASADFDEICGLLYRAAMDREPRIMLFTRRFDHLDFSYMAMRLSTSVSRRLIQAPGVGKGV